MYTNLFLYCFLPILKYLSFESIKTCHLLKVQSKICGENRLLQQLHHVAIFFRAEVCKDIVTLWEKNITQLTVEAHIQK